MPPDRRSESLACVGTPEIERYQAKEKGAPLSTPSSIRV